MSGEFERPTAPADRAVIRRDAEPASLRAYGYGLALVIFVSR